MSHRDGGWETEGNRNHLPSFIHVLKALIKLVNSKSHRCSCPEIVSTLFAWPLVSSISKTLWTPLKVEKSTKGDLGRGKLWHLVFYLSVFLSHLSEFKVIGETAGLPPTWGNEEVAAFQVNTKNHFAVQLDATLSGHWSRQKKTTKVSSPKSTWMLLKQEWRNT